MNHLYRSVSILIVVSICLSACKQKASPEATLAFASVIPKPVSAIPDGGAFFLNKETAIVWEPSDGAGPVANYLSAKLFVATGYSFRLITREREIPSNTIALLISKETNDLGDEGYTLSVTPDQIRIEANKPAGLFHGVQTLRQLLPDQVESTSMQEVPWEIATGTIRDFPRYAWRGSMLDVARHFFSIEDVKRFIDFNAMYKFNIVHLHLTDDQGWRIEIKSWPNLALHGGSTQVGGGKAGYFTQEQFKEIVAYAQKQFITIVPEIELPSHINAALASYGELNGGTIVPEEGKPVGPGTAPQILDGTNKPTKLYEGIEVGWSTLRIEKPQTFKFVEDVIREMAQLTPGPYLHIGGDEAWVTKKEDYITFINRFKGIVEANGKRMVGWEEIGQAELNANAIVQFWTKPGYLQLAADKGAHIIMSPSKKVYLDMKYDSLTKLGLNWAAYIDVKDAYDWDPSNLIDGIDEKSILGVEAPLWSETISTMNDIEYLLFPRLPGVAEVGWSSVSNKNWEEYRRRLGRHGKRLNAMKINFYQSPQVDWSE